MDKSSLRKKIFSPLYLAVSVILIVIIGNVSNWLDIAYGTHLNVFNPLLVLLTVVLFGMYIYSVRDQYKKSKRS